MVSPTQERLLELIRTAGVFRARDLEDQGFRREQLRRLLAQGLVEQIGRGLYRVLSRIDWHLPGGHRRGWKVVVEREALPEVIRVTLLVREADETFEVPPEFEAELLESIAEADRGETISAGELIERLRRIA